MFDDPDRVATTSDFGVLGRAHGHEFFLVANDGSVAGPGESQRFLKWMARRMVDMAKDLRSLGASEDDVMAWHDAVVASYSEHVENRKSRAKL